MKNYKVSKKIYCIALAMFFAFAFVLGVVIGMPKEKVGAESNAIPSEMEGNATFLRGLYQTLSFNGQNIPCYVMPSLTVIEREEVSQSGQTYVGQAVAYSSLQIAFALDSTAFLPTGDVYLISNSFWSDLFSLTSGVGNNAYICGLKLNYDGSTATQYISTGSDSSLPPYVTDRNTYTIYQNSSYQLSQRYAVNFAVPGSGYYVNLMNYLSLYSMTFNVYKDVMNLFTVSSGQTNFLLNPLTFKITVTSATPTGSSAVLIELQTQPTNGAAPIPLFDFQILQTSVKILDLSVDNSFLQRVHLRTGTSSTVFSFEQKYYNDYGYVSGDYQSGYDVGYARGEEFGNSQGYSNGYAKGYEEGISAGSNYSFLSLMTSVVDAPVKAFTGLLDFNVLGFNMAGLVISLLSVALLLKIVLVFKNGG